MAWAVAVIAVYTVHFGILRPILRRAERAAMRRATLFAPPGYHRESHFQRARAIERAIGGLDYAFLIAIATSPLLAALWLWAVGRL